MLKIFNKINVKSLMDKTIKYALITIILSFYLIPMNNLFAIDPVQFRREGFIFDEKGNKIGNALLELELFYEEKGETKSNIYQTVSNDLGLYFFNLFLEIKPEKILAVKIFWKNYQTKFSEKYLRFSPGFNPHWEFTKKYLDNENAIDEIPFSRVRDIKLISMENPVPDDKARKLALRFSPILVFDKGKDELPSNLEKYAFNHKIEAYKVKTKIKDSEGLPPFKGKYLQLPELKKFKSLALKKKPFLYYHVRPLKTYYTGMQTNRLEDFYPQYYWYSSSQDEASGYVISYWFWYDTTDGPSYLGNSHRGGLQGYAVLLDSNDKPKRILTIGHNQVLVDTSWHNVNSVNHHPILYTAYGFLSDGTNVTIPNLPSKKDAFSSRKSIQVPVNKRFVDWFGFPRDKFPLMNNGDFKVIIPGKKGWGSEALKKDNLKKVLIGPGPVDDSKNSRFIDFSKKIKGVWQRAIKWEEPGWVNKASFKDPDGQHNIDEESSFFMGFNGRIGNHPIRIMKFLPPHYYGQSPVNVPFEKEKNNIFIYEYPRRDRSFFFEEKKHYGPFWKGNKNTPQLIK